MNRSDLESLRGLGLNTRGTMQILDLNLFKTTDSNIVIRYLVIQNLVPTGTRPLVGTRRYRTNRMSRIGPVPVARAHDARRPVDAPESWFDSMSRHELLELKFNMLRC